MKKGLKWTKDEIEYLKTNYSNDGSLKCAIHLERSKRGVLEQVKKLGLKMNLDAKYKLISKYNKSILENATYNAECYADVIRNLGIIPQAGNYAHIRNQLIKFNIDTSHFKSPGELTSRRLKNKEINDANYFQEKPLEKYLINGIRTDNRKLKEKLFKANLKENKCELCGIDENWNGRILSLRLDHINGINTDYRIENLRIICPNCDSTLDTYCSKNRIKDEVKRKQTFSVERQKVEHIRKCNHCNSEYASNSKKQKFCSNKCHKLSLRKCIRPAYEMLIDDINELGYVNTGKKYKVSDTSIRHWIKQYEKQASVGERVNPTNS